MRRVSNHAFEAQFIPRQKEIIQQNTNLVIDEWLNFKGEVQLQEDGGKILLTHTGQRHQLFDDNIITNIGILRSIKLIESNTSGVFRTELTIGIGSNIVAITCSLSFGGSDTPVAPLHYDAKCPFFIKPLLKMEVDDARLEWRYMGTQIPSGVVPFIGHTGGTQFMELVNDKNRSLPIIAKSIIGSHLDERGVYRAISYDLAGLAIVATLDYDAAWGITNSVGAEWSCFGGAIRIYWPIKENDSPRRHPYWSEVRIMEDLSVNDAIERFRKQIRTRIMGLSAYSTWEPKIISDIQRANRLHSLELQKMEAQSIKDYQELADQLIEKLSEYENVIKQRDEDIFQLKEDIRNLQEVLQWQNKLTEEIEPDEALIETRLPNSIEEAVRFAMEELSKDLLFGEDISRGLHSVQPEACPPAKVFDHLSKLAELTRLRREGTIGVDAISWLKNNNVDASGESDTVLRSPRHMRNRTWHDGNQRREFEFHTKLNDNVPSDRCVRIYYDYDDSIGKTIIAWVGRHPD